MNPPVFFKYTLVRVLANRLIHVFEFNLPPEDEPRLSPREATLTINHLGFKIFFSGAVASVLRPDGTRDKVPQL